MVVALGWAYTLYGGLSWMQAVFYGVGASVIGIIAFVDGVTAAAIGAISGAVIVLGRRTIFENGWRPDLFKVALMLVTLGILSTTKKVPEPLIILSATILGLIAFPILSGS